MNNLSYYTETFGVTVQQLEKVCAEALAHGGDYCDLYFENTTFFNLLLKDGVVSSGGFHTDYGVGIRVLKGEKTGYAYSESTEMADMVKAAEAASAIALGSDARMNFTQISDRRHDLYPMERNWRHDPADTFLPFIKNLESSIFAKDGRIVKVIIIRWSSPNDQA